MCTSLSSQERHIHYGRVWLPACQFHLLMQYALVASAGSGDFLKDRPAHKHAARVGEWPSEGHSGVEAIRLRQVSGLDRKNCSMVASWATSSLIQHLHCSIKANCWPDMFAFLRQSSDVSNLVRTSAWHLCGQSDALHYSSNSWPKPFQVPNNDTICLKS